MFDAERFCDDELRMFDSASKALMAEKRFGPCDDDVEVTTPYVNMLPEESQHEEGSPLNFESFRGKGCHESRGAIPARSKAQRLIALKIHLSKR